MLGKNYIWNYLQQLLEVNYYYHYGTITRKNLYKKKKSMNTDYSTYWRSQLQKKIYYKCSQKHSWFAVTNDNCLFIQKVNGYTWNQEKKAPIIINQILVPINSGL
jgi:DNA modification methylase